MRLGKKSVSRTRRQSKLLTVLAWVAAFGILLLAGMLGWVWALPGRVPLGQTIPPPPTATPTDTVSAQPTATWTPRPTWTRMATQPPELPTATATPAVSLPTATRPLMPTGTKTMLQATATSGVLVPSPSTTSAPSPTPAFPTLLLTPTRELPGTPAPLPPSTPPVQAIPLAFEVAVLPHVAGPLDAVQFILQVANVGYGLVEGVQVEVVFPNDLELGSVECARCTTDCPQCSGGPMPTRLTIFIGDLVPGDQVIAPVHMQVAEDAWPGQTLLTDWTLTATGLPPQTARAGVGLPWAQLPRTGY